MCRPDRWALAGPAARRAGLQGEWGRSKREEDEPAAAAAAAAAKESHYLTLKSGRQRSSEYHRCVLGGATRCAHRHVCVHMALSTACRRDHPACLPAHPNRLGSPAGVTFGSSAATPSSGPRGDSWATAAACPGWRLHGRCGTVPTPRASLRSSGCPLRPQGWAGPRQFGPSRARMCPRSWGFWSCCRGAAWPLCRCCRCCWAGAAQLAPGPVPWRMAVGTAQATAVHHLTARRTQLGLAVAVMLWRRRRRWCSSLGSMRSRRRLWRRQRRGASWTPAHPQPPS